MRNRRIIGVAPSLLQFREQHVARHFRQWQIERKLIEDAVRPIIFFMRQGTCWQPEVKGLTLMDNSIFNSWRMEDVWLDR